MGVKIRENRGRIFLDIYDHGVRHWEALDLWLTGDANHDKEVRMLAEIARGKRIEQLHEQANGLIDRIAAEMLLVQYAEKTIEAKHEHRKNPLPKSMKYLREFAGNVRLKQITPSFVERYKQFLKDQPALSAATQQKYFEAFRSLMRRAVMERLIPSDPCVSVKNIRVPAPQTYSLTLAELEKLAKTPLGGTLGAEVRRMFLFGLYTGLRVSDIRALQWKQIQRDPLSITVKQQKTSEPVQIPLHEIAFNIIDDGALHLGEEYVFPHAATTKTSLNQYLVLWAKKAGIEKPLGFHVARRTFGTLILQGGSDLATVSKLLGHTNLRHTARYLKTDTERQQAAIASLPVIDIEPKQAEIVQFKVK
ncbi:MAG TPA: site-specific integrase [Rectinema sp.]|jgi:integrase|nr:site-specific integrase [Rectinema sp.]HOR77600.1 site-specific integrase [Anaerolineaceae bacterium]HPK26325.1 site-specific integrase [Anaerolineaceae bacterium]HQK34784.1 site-specific integrase [Spirochaetales bacterium]HRU78309.1 site-specific integrase [Rectinema sp.]